MIEIIQQLWILGVHLLQNIEKFLRPFLKNLDPSLFQNITLGVLAIFIPFAIVLLTDILNSKKEKRSKFEKMVLNDEVFGTKKVFLLSIGSIVFFSFFSGIKTPSLAKISSIIVAVILVSFFWKYFNKILRFSEGYKPEFEIPFLKKMSFSRVFWFKNKSKAEKMLRAWGSFWSEKTEFIEREFTKIFISHIDDAAKFGKFDVAIQLAQTYANNIEKRDHFSIGYEILPKVFEWNETFRNEQQLWLKNCDTEKRIRSFFSQKYLPTFCEWTLKLYKKIIVKRENFWRWNYFGVEFFQAIISALLKDQHSSYQLFSLLKKYVEESEKKLDKIEDREEKEKYWRYIKGIFASFCPIFFNEINKAPSNYEIWEDNFPVEWRIAITNKDNRISHVILDKFLHWSEDRIFKKDNKDSFDGDLTEVINGIFPNVHSSLFTAFLMLFFSSEIKYALEKEPSFYILGVSVSWSGSIEETEKEQNQRISEMMQLKEISQKEETIQIIFNYFGWNQLRITLDDSNKNEWDNASDDRKKEMLKIARKEKLEKLKAEIESDEIKKVCENCKQKEFYRKKLLELITLLLLEIEK